MSDHSKIQWTEATWQPVTGCNVISAGCTHCYAMRLAGGRLRHHPSRAGLTRETAAGPVWTGEVRFNAEWLDQPLRWQRPRRIFVCAHGDLFHPAVPDEWIDKVFAVMADAGQHTFQVLTKRPERMREYLSPENPRYTARRVFDLTHGEAGKFDCDIYWPLPNVHLGVSVENQETADERIPLLLATPAAVRFVSAEPLLAPVDLTRLIVGQLPGDPPGPAEVRCIKPLMGEVWWTDPRSGRVHLDRLSSKLDWLIVGGESGPGARPCDVAWIRSLVEQCRAAGVPAFVKQLGARPGCRNAAGGFDNWRVGHGNTYIRHAKGADPAEWPADLRVREFPR